MQAHKQKAAANLELLKPALIATAKTFSKNQGLKLLLTIPKKIRYAVDVPAEYTEKSVIEVNGKKIKP